MQSSGSDGKGRHTIVEEGTKFKGALSSSCPVDVRGRIEGDLETPSLTVSASGVVHGKARVGSVRSEGELSGEFDADSVELAGTVRDSTVIRARELEVKLSVTRGKMQVTFGNCELSVGDEPADAVAESEPGLSAQGPQAAPSLEAEAEDDEESADGEADSPGGGKKRRKRRAHAESDDAEQSGWQAPTTG